MIYEVLEMDYAEYRQQDYPIDSAGTEAACETLIKQRLCCFGMRWKEKGASVILSLRALALRATRWEQFWSKLNQDGFPVAVYLYHVKVVSYQSN